MYEKKVLSYKPSTFDQVLCFFCFAFSILGFAVWAYWLFFMTPRL